VHQLEVLPDKKEVHTERPEARLESTDAEVVTARRRKVQEATSDHDSLVSDEVPVPPLLLRHKRAGSQRLVSSSLLLADTARRLL
jgi:hypothetical protein